MNVRGMLLLLRAVLKAAGLLAVALCAQPGCAESGNPTVNFGFYMPAIRDANLADVKVSLRSWAEEMGKPYGVNIATATYDDMPSLRSAMDRADLNFVVASGMELAEIFSPHELLGGWARRTGREEGMALVVSKASGIRQFSDLRGKRVVRLSNDRLSEILLETLCLKAAGQDCRNYLVLAEDKRDVQSVHSVFFGRADAALVTLSTLRIAEELNPQVAERLAVILDWKAAALIFGLSTQTTDPAIRRLILRSAGEAIRLPRGRQMLEMFKTDNIEPVDADALQPYRDLLLTYRLLLRARSTRKK